MSAILTDQAVEAATLASAEEPFRAHLGASLIGRACERQLWYGFHWVLAEKHKASLLRLFRRGQREEAHFVAILKSIGCEVWEADPATGKQFRISRENGHYGGSLDGVARGCPDLPPDTPFLTEFKTHNDKSFKKLQEEGLLRAKWEHFCQMQEYMGEMSLLYGLYCAVNKNDDQLYFELVKYSQSQHEIGKARANRIVWSPVPSPRIAEQPSNFNCKWCHFQRLCHFGDVAPVKSCRTCKFSKPSADSIAKGLWQCDHPIQDDSPLCGNYLTEEEQRRGCQYYQVNPVLTGRQP